jgi:hypothetical protein
MRCSFNIFIDALTCGRTDIPVNPFIDVRRCCGRDVRSRDISSCSFTELEVNFGGGISVPIRAAFVSRVSGEHRITETTFVFRLLFPTLAYKHSY